MCTIYPFNMKTKLKNEQRKEREAKVWRGLKHVHILPFYGIAEIRLGVSSSSVLQTLVSPWMKNGSIVMYLSDPTRVDDLELKLKLVSQN